MTRLGAGAWLVFVLGTTSTTAQTPKIDYGALGSVAVVGSFAGLELYDPRSSVLLPANASNSTTTTSIAPNMLFELDATGQLHRFVQAQEGASIQAIATCTSQPDVVYFGGNFTQVIALENGTTIPINNIGAFNTQSSTLVALGQGLDGPVTALVCDASTQTLFAAGHFNAPIGVSSASTYKGAAAAWSALSSSWSPLPFGGFPGGPTSIDIKTLSILANSDSTRSLLFGGRLSTFWANTSSVNVTASGSNASVILRQSNATTSVSANGTATVLPSLGSSLVPISLSAAEVTASSSSSNNLYQTPQSILCPAGQDGSAKSTWKAQDATVGRITARLFTPLVVGGFRIGNTFVDGDGTQTFSITALPNNNVLTLNYRTDPSSHSSSLATCSDACPLSHDAAIAYEDFLVAPSVSFSQSTTITGFEITMTGHYGNAAGLHLLQLLSSGSYAFASDELNNGYGGGVCASGPYPSYGKSSAVHTPGKDIGWDQVQVVSTTVAGTKEDILCGATPVNTDSVDAPTTTWYPYISQDNDKYEIYYFTPACSFDSTCGQRGFIDVVVTITGADATAVTTTVNQEVTDDTYSLVYSGPIKPISGNDEVQVSMGLSKSKKATLAADKGDKYYLIADKILVSAAGSTSGAGSTQVKVGSGMTAVNVTSVESQTGQIVAFTPGSGLWEWNMAQSVPAVPFISTATHATHQIPSINSASPINKIGFGLPRSSSITGIVQSDAALFIGGDFAYSQSGVAIRSVAMYSVTGNVLSSANGGLNGIVAGLAVLGDWLYAVGSFNATADGTVTGLNGKARWQYGMSGSKWQPVSGLSSTKPALAVSAKHNDRLVFTYDRRHIDIWFPSNSSVATTAASFVIGSFSTVQQAVNGSAVFLSGTTYALNQFATSSMALLTAQGVHPVHLAFDSSAAASSQNSKRASPAWSPANTGVLEAIKGRTRSKRQRSTTSPGQTLLRSTQPTSADPSIMAAAFWHNATSNEDVTIIGGTFGLQADNVHNLGVLSASGQLSTLPNADGIVSVSSLKISGDLLWVAGQLSSSDDSAVLAAYDLTTSHWSPVVSAKLAMSGGAPLVNAIIVDNHADLIIVGHFDSIGGQRGTSSIAKFDSEIKSWQAFGNGVPGVIESVSSVGDSLFVAGNLETSGSTAYVAVWFYSNSTWMYLPNTGLPGPPNSITADTENSVFVSGVVAGASSSYLRQWDGQVWTEMPSGVANAAGGGSLDSASSAIQQITLMPLTDPVTPNSVFSDANRALLALGALTLPSLGQASAAIFDSASWYPFLLTTGRDGQQGRIAALAYSMSTITFGGNHHLAVGLVILISIAISLGIIFLGVLIALIIALNTRTDDSHAYPIVIPPYDNLDPAKISPTPLLLSEKEQNAHAQHGQASILETINAATAQVAGARLSTPIQPHGRHQSAGASTAVMTNISDDDSIYDQRDMDAIDGSFPMRGVRYSFIAEKEEEIDINTGDMIEVVDDSDDQWTLVRRIRDGKQGFVPAAFLA